jgi:peptide chain release factor 2
VSVQAGTGGTESCDWARMLVRMYTRWGEQNGFKVEEIDHVADDASGGIRSATLQIDGPYAYGWLRAEIGVHRLIRISPFDSNKRRQTSFSSVDVTPVVDEDLDLVIDEKELNVEKMRAGGAGGQHVNKTESAVRITHIPTGIVVKCQNERSQTMNMASAMKQLKAKLLVIEEAKRDAEIKGLSGPKTDNRLRPPDPDLHLHALPAGEGRTHRLQEGQRRRGDGGRPRRIPRGLPALEGRAGPEGRQPTRGRPPA